MNAAAPQLDLFTDPTPPPPSVVTEPSGDFVDLDDDPMTEPDYSEPAEPIMDDPIGPPELEEPSVDDPPRESRTRSDTVFSDEMHHYLRDLGLEGTFVRCKTCGVFHPKDDLNRYGRCPRCLQLLAVSPVGTLVRWVNEGYGRKRGKIVEEFILTMISGASLPSH